MAGYKIQDARCKIQDSGCKMQDARCKSLSCIVNRVSCIRSSRASCIVHLDNEKGIALFIVLILSVIALAIMAGLLYMVTSGTQISGIQKRYKTAIEAGLGGKDVTYQVIKAKGDPGIPKIAFSFSTAFTNACQGDKLNKPTFIGSTYNWTNCTNQNAATSLTIDPNTPSTYDMTFQLGAYTVYAKIVDTVEGNSRKDEGFATDPDGTIPAQHIPYLYTIEICALDAANTAERAKLSILYQY